LLLSAKLGDIFY